MSLEYWVILDLDGTLIFSVEGAYNGKYHRKLPDYVHNDFYGYVRPGARDFVRALQDYFKVAVWTAASQQYAELVVPAVFADRPPEFILDRTCCTTTAHKPHYIIKDLSLIPLHNLLIVDDTPQTYSLNSDQAVPVTSWRSPDEAEPDNELLHVALPTIFKHFGIELSA